MKLEKSRAKDTVGCFALKNIKKGTLISQEIQKHVWLLARPAAVREEDHIPDFCREFALNILSFLDELMPCPFTGPKTFWAGPNFLC